MQTAPPVTLTGKPGLSLVIGMKDEEDNVEPLIDEIAEVGVPDHFDLELILIDDGSTDRTMARIAEQMRKRPWIRCYRHERNYGKTATWKTAFPLATRDVIAVMDADLQNDPRDILPMYQALAEGYDAVSGQRRRRADTLSRKIQSRIANHVRRFFLKDNALDCGCGLKMFRRTLLSDVPLFNGSHRFFEALAQIHGYRFRQVLVNDRKRIYGKAKYGLRNRAIGPLVDMFGVYWIRKRVLLPRSTPFHPSATNQSPAEPAQAQ